MAHEAPGEMGIVEAGLLPRAGYNAGEVQEGKHSITSLLELGPPCYRGGLLHGTAEVAHGVQETPGALPHPPLEMGA